MKSLFLAFSCFFTLFCSAQHSLEIKTVNEKGETIPSVTVSWNGQLAQTNDSGVYRIADIAAGKHRFKFSHASFEEVTVDIEVPANTSWTVTLHEAEEEEEEVIVTATRTSRTIANSPTRVEVISGEELEEKGNMKPGDIRMLLNESTGIQVQQTSATSYNSSIRIQGLDGRYTQILKDGFPLYSGFSGGLSLLQIVPLDLRQVEVIKGSSSTLYGGGAIAGLVNLVSRVPGAERAINFMANGTSGGGLDLSAFYSEWYGKLGATVFLSRNSNDEFDPGNTGFTAIPQFERYTINPRLFYRAGTLSFDVGMNFTTEDRIGGAMDYFKHGGDKYFEGHYTDRTSVQATLKKSYPKNRNLVFKNSYSHFDRSIQVQGYAFSGVQRSVFSELSFASKGERSEWVLGANIIADDFEEVPGLSGNVRNHDLWTTGLFGQYTFSATDKLTIESGLRADQVRNFGSELLPRISIMYKISPAITTRIGGGLGYKTPTIFTEEAERIHFRNLNPINNDQTKNERSAGLNADFNIHFETGEVEWSINQLFFYTRLNDPLQLVNVFAPGGGYAEFRNADGYISTKGMETNIKAILGNFKLFVGYTLADVERKFNGVASDYPLTARHRLNNVLMFEVDESWKLGLEAYYFGKQQLTDGSSGRSYWITGFMAEKIWEKFSVFINFENFSNTRQSKWEPIFTGTLQEPVFKDIYAPLEGFVVNGGFKLRL